MSWNLRNILVRRKNSCKIHYYIKDVLEIKCHLGHVTYKGLQIFIEIEKLWLSWVDFWVYFGHIKVLAVSCDLKIFKKLYIQDFWTNIRFFFLLINVNSYIWSFSDEILVYYLKQYSWSHEKFFSQCFCYRIK